MKTIHLVAIVGPVVAVLAFAPAVPVLSPLLCLAALPALGELWLRALIREPLTPVARLGLSVVTGLISLPLVALALYALGLHIERRGLAAGLALLAMVLGGFEIALNAQLVSAGGYQPADKPDPAESPHPESPHPDSPHPGHWVGRVEHGGTTNSRPLSTALAVGVPALLALLIGGTATVVYQRLPHPAEPGYTSLALSGWAAGIARPVAIPTAGVEVPLEVSSAGEPTQTAELRVRVGDRSAGPGVPVSISAGTHALRVHVPAPTDGCLRPIRISLGQASTVFYGRGPFPARILTRRGPVPC